MEEKTKKYDNIVKNNKLINAEYKLTLGEQRLILSMCSKISTDDTILEENEISVREFFEIFKIESKDNYEYLKSIVRRVSKRVLTIESDSGFKVFPWIHHIEYKKNSGKIIVQFHDYLAPYLLFVKNNIYTKYQLDIVAGFRSEYSYRIYELSKQVFPQRCSRIIHLETLRNLLGIEGNKYKEFGNLRARVLDVAVRDINLMSDIKIDIKPIKSGRKIIAIQVDISDNLKIKNWDEYETLKKSGTKVVAKLLAKELYNRYKIKIEVSSLSIYGTTAILGVIFELREGYFEKYNIKNPMLYFLKTLENKSVSDGYTSRSE